MRESKEVIYMVSSRVSANTTFTMFRDTGVVGVDMYWGKLTRHPDIQCDKQSSSGVYDDCMGVCVVCMCACTCFPTLSGPQSPNI